jgi:hypothetical protein
VYSSGILTNFYNDTFKGQFTFVDSSDVPVSNSSSRFAGQLVIVILYLSSLSLSLSLFFSHTSPGPSKRWRHSMAVGSVHLNSDGEYIQNVAVFGGHRLWHGYSLENSYLNEWSSYVTRPSGGYLSDLWIYTKYLDFDTFPGQTYKTNDGKWKLKKPKKQCFPDAGLSWDAR